MSAIGYVPNGAYLRSDDDKSNSEAATVVLRELEKVKSPYNSVYLSPFTVCRLPSAVCSLLSAKCCVPSAVCYLLSVFSLRSLLAP
jgi:hypothetical protein